MKKFLGIILIILLWISPVMAMTTPIIFLDTPDQDPLNLPPFMHELGEFIFPPDELIASVYEVTDLTACSDPVDDPSTANILVSMTNLTSIPWYNVHYVSDFQIPIISNFDGFIGSGIASPDDLAPSFKIDNVGINAPLVSESIIPNLIFEPNETWEFIIQDFLPILGGFPTPFSSVGIAGLSVFDMSSTGSIIASPIPVPTTMLLLGSGILGLAGFRKRYKKRSPYQQRSHL
jgi:hypothetical protein